MNHYLSQFFCLCLGYRENERDKVAGPGIDAVFAGHAHWNMEFQLRKPEGAVYGWSPELLYGKFSNQVEATCHDPHARWRPLLLQTAACGPAGPVGTEVPPNFRYVHRACKFVLTRLMKKRYVSCVTRDMGHE